MEKFQNKIKIISILGLILFTLSTLLAFPYLDWSKEEIMANQTAKEIFFGQCMGVIGMMFAFLINDKKSAENKLKTEEKCG